MADKNVSKQENKQEKGSTCKVVTSILVGGWVVMLFLIGTFYTENSLLKSGSSGVRPTAGNTGQPTGQPNDQFPEDTFDFGTIARISSEDHYRGGNEAKVVLIEYSDFECSFCKSFHPTAQRALQEYGPDFGWVYRHLPLDQIHPNARKIAEASECVKISAGGSGFWAFTDSVYEQDQIPTSDSELEALATAAGANLSDFQSCMSSGETAQLVEDDYSQAIAAGISGTPGNFLVSIENGEIVPLQGAVPYEILKAELDRLLAK